MGDIHSERRWDRKQILDSPWKRGNNLILPVCALKTSDHSGQNVALGSELRFFYFSRKAIVVFDSTTRPISEIRFQYSIRQVGELLKILCLGVQLNTESSLQDPPPSSPISGPVSVQSWNGGSGSPPQNYHMNSSQRLEEEVCAYFQGLHTSPDQKNLPKMEYTLFWPKHLILSIYLMGIYVLQERWILPHNLPQYLISITFQNEYNYCIKLSIGNFPLPGNVF